jgi:hypothetical protein
MNNINNNNKNDSILNKSKHTINKENICPNINNENDISFANSRNESIQ